MTQYILLTRKNHNHVGPKLRMVSYVMTTWSTFQIPMTSDYVFLNTSRITFSPDIRVRTRQSTSFSAIILGLGSDRGPEFVSRFFRSLGKALDMKLHFTSGYHPEGDGQTEQTNQTLKQYMRIFCNYQQDNWYTLLPLAEFAYNNTPSATTGISLFFANKGYHPNLTDRPSGTRLSFITCQRFNSQSRRTTPRLKKTVADAQLPYQGPADAKCAPAPDLVVGQQAFVKAKFFQTTRPSHKLSDKYLGPFEILAKAGSHSYTLQLPVTFRGQTLRKKFDPVLFFKFWCPLAIEYIYFTSYFQWHFLI